MNHPPSADRPAQRSHAADLQTDAHIIFDTELLEHLSLTGPITHHLIRVRRLRGGEFLSVSPGDGTVRRYEIVATGKDSLDLSATDPIMQITPPLPLTLAFAPPRHDRWEAIFRAGTELGVTGFTPLVSDRSVQKWSEANTARAMRIVLEALQQSRGSWIPDIHSPVALAELLGDNEGAGVALADAPHYGHHSSAVNAMEIHTLIVGPEGGFSDGERSRMAAIPRLVVGDAVLRTETAAIAGVSALLTLRGVQTSVPPGKTL